MRKSISVGNCSNIELTSAWTGAPLSTPELQICYDWTLVHWTILSIGSYCLNQQEIEEDKTAVQWGVEKTTILSILSPADMTNGTKRRKHWNGRYVMIAQNFPAKSAAIQMDGEHCEVMLQPLFWMFERPSSLSSWWHPVKMQHIKNGLIYVSF